MKLINKLGYSDKIILGIDVLDYDHKKIFSLINQINDAEVEQSSNLLSLIEQLVSYSKYHLQREELMMKACAYPFLDNHHQVHEFMINRLLDYQQCCIDNLTKKTVEQLNNFLLEWWQDHILSFDKSYQHWMKKNEDFVSDANQMFENENLRP